MAQEVTQLGPTPHPIGLYRLICWGDDGLYLMGVATPNASNPSNPTSGGQWQAEMFKFNICTGKWTAMTPIAPNNTNMMLASRCTAFLDRHRLLIAGGRLVSKNFDSPSHSVYIYDLKSQKTIDITPVDGFGEAQWSWAYCDFFDQTLLRWNNSFVLCSRIMDSRSVRRRFIFHQISINGDLGSIGDENADHGSIVNWKDLSPVFNDDQPIHEPKSGDLCELAIYNDYIYCIDKSHAEMCLDVEWRYNLRCKRWERVETEGMEGTEGTNCGKPMDRIFASCVSYGDCVYVAGGSAIRWAQPRSTRVLSDVWRLHLPTLRWSVTPVRLPEGVYFHCADITRSGTMYVFGGYTDMAGRNASHKLFRLDLIGPPSLSRLSWRMVVRMNEHKLEEKSEKELMNMRVPLACIFALKW